MENPQVLAKIKEILIEAGFITVDQSEAMTHAQRPHSQESSLDGS